MVQSQPEGVGVAPSRIPRSTFEATMVAPTVRSLLALTFEHADRPRETMIDQPRPKFTLAEVIIEENLRQSVRELVGVGREQGEGDGANGGETPEGRKESRFG